MNVPGKILKIEIINSSQRQGYYALSFSNFEYVAALSQFDSSLDISCDWVH